MKDQLKKIVIFTLEDSATEVSDYRQDFIVILATNFTQTMLQRDFQTTSKKWSKIHSLKGYISEQPLGIENRNQTHCVRKRARKMPSICIQQNSNIYINILKNNKEVSGKLCAETERMGP